MARKRKSSTEDPVKATRKLVDKIRNELPCTEAEAYFTLRSFVNPPEDVYFDPGPEVENNPPQPTLKWALSYTKRILDASNECREEVEKGKTMRLFEAIHVYGMLGFPLPQWATERLERARESYNFHIAKTLDEAFKIKRPPNYPHKKAIEAANLSFNIYWRCRELSARGLKTGAESGGLLQTVGGEYRIGRGKVREYYYFWKKNYSSFGPLSVPELMEPLIRPRARKMRQPK